MMLKKFLLFGCATVLLLHSSHSPPAYASERTNGCHCYRNRTFNPDDTFSSDEFLLTTTFNSLLASEFNISKRQVIMMKMREGVENNDLLTALYLAKFSGRDVSQLLQMKKKQSWENITRQLANVTSSPDLHKLLKLITNDSSDVQITEHIINFMISSRFSPSQDSLDQLHKQGLNSREVILVYTLARQTGASAPQIADTYRTKGLSWSEIAHNFGLQPADVAKLFEDAKKEDNK